MSSKVEAVCRRGAPLRGVCSSFCQAASGALLVGRPEVAAFLHFACRTHLVDQHGQAFTHGQPHSGQGSPHLSDKALSGLLG